MLRRKCIALSVKFKRENRSKINNLSYYFKKLEKNSKKIQRKRNSKSKNNTNELDNKKTREEINKEKKLVSWKKWIELALSIKLYFFFLNLAPSLYRGIGNNTKHRYNNKFLGPPYSPKLVTLFFLRLFPPTMYMSLLWLILHLTWLG